MTTPGCLRIDPLLGVDAETVADALWALGATAIGELADGRLEVGFVSDDEARVAASALGERWPDLASAVEVVDAGSALQAALEAWLPHARPFRVGRLHVRPSFLGPHDDDTAEPAAGERTVVVDPTLAFGYDHPSTVAGLEVIERTVAPGSSVLDVGCGSGVLAVAAAVLGAGRVVAVDVDPVAVAATRAAAEANGVGPVVEPSTTPVEVIEGRFDLVVANIGARTLGALAPAIVERVADGGTLVLAGLLTEQVDDVVAAYESAGIGCVSVGERDGWAAPVFLGFLGGIHH